MKKLEVFINRFRRFVYPTGAFLLLTGGLFILVSQLINVPFHIPTSYMQLFFIVFLNLFLLFLSADIYFHTSKEEQGEKGIWCLLGFSGINFVFLFLIDHYYRNPERINYVSVTLILKLLPFLLGILGISFLFFLWLSIRKSLSGFTQFAFLSDSNEKRFDNFSPLIFLGVCFVVGLVIRLINLGNFPLYVDEYNATHDAISLIHGQVITWSRAFLTVSMPVFFGFKIFGISEWAGRVPMVLINMISIVPIFYLGKRINKFVGYTCVILFVTNPWIIAVSRTMREYAIIPLFFFSTSILLLDLLKWEGLDWRQYFKKNNWRILILSAILIYTVIDSQSILKINLVAYGVFVVLLLLKAFKQKLDIKIKIGLIFSLVLLSGLMLYMSHVIDHLISDKTMVYHSTDVYFRVFVNGIYHQWYSSYLQIGYVIITFSILLALWILFKKNNSNDYAALFVIGTFAAVLIFLSFFLISPSIPERTRYGVLLEYWYIFLVAIFFYAVYRILNAIGIVQRKSLTIPILSLFFVAFFVNYHAISTVLNYKGGGQFVVTGERHYITEPAYEYLLPQVKDGDVMLTNSFYYYDELHLNQFKNINRLHYFDLLFKAGEDIGTVIHPYPDGWIVLYPNGEPAKHGIPFTDFSAGGKTVHYLGTWGEVYIWHWETDN